MNKSSFNKKLNRVAWLFNQCEFLCCVQRISLLNAESYAFLETHYLDENGIKCVRMERFDNPKHFVYKVDYRK